MENLTQSIDNLVDAVWVGTVIISVAILIASWCLAVSVDALKGPKT